MTRTRYVVWILLAAAIPAARGAGPQAGKQGAAPATSSTESLAKGVVVPRVPCGNNPSMSYALYLPSAYTAEKKWPILYAFDPEAIGRAPVELAKDAAEHYGYIVAGSNDSQNGPIQAEIEAAQAMWKDTHARFAIDDARVYLTGFSGGSRAAATVALSCQNCAAGVFAHGAGFPVAATISKGIRFVYFAAVGEKDFNYPELSNLSNQLDALGIANFLRRFDGAHQWAPAEVWMEALGWMELMGMKEGRRPRDDALIAEEFARAQQRASALEQSGQSYQAYQIYRSWATNFPSLGDVAPFTRRAAELGDSAAVRAGKKRERDEIKLQRDFTAELEPQMKSLPADPVARATKMAELKPNIEHLQHLRDSSNEPAKARAAQRAVAQLFATAYEAGQQAEREKNRALALAFFELAAEIGPKSPMPAFQIACLYAQSGDKKHALGALREAIAKGLMDAEFVRNTPEFARLRDDPEFKRLVGGLPAKPE